eukprot:6211360-Pleurochrysis_carterae.AAC.1
MTQEYCSVPLITQRNLVRQCKENAFRINRTTYEKGTSDARTAHSELDRVPFSSDAPRQGKDFRLSQRRMAS